MFLLNDSINGALIPLFISRSFSHTDYLEGLMKTGPTIVSTGPCPLKFSWLPLCLLVITIKVFLDNIEPNDLVFAVKVES